MTSTFQRPAIGKCRQCKAAYRVDATVTRTETPTHTHTGAEGWPRVTVRVDYPRRECCGRPVTFDLIRGRVTDQPCDARCEGATGRQCECSCGGKNHGRSHAA